MTQESQAVNSSVTLSMREGVEIIEIQNQYACASVSTFGATVLSYTPVGQADLLWVSKDAVYDQSKPIRGGIPVCWPWFGRSQIEGYPAHGVVRNKVWRLERTETAEDGTTSVTLVTFADDATKVYWPHEFKLSLTVEVGAELNVTLTTQNLSDVSVDITEALHTYFQIADPRGLVIDGLEGSVHVDKLVENADPETQKEPLVLQPAKDSVYFDQHDDINIEDRGHGRVINICKQHSQSTVVWNPGPEIVKGFSDMDDDAWLEFVCVESGNVFDNAVKIHPHSEHSLIVTYSIKNS